MGSLGNPSPRLSAAWQGRQPVWLIEQCGVGALASAPTLSGPVRAVHPGRPTVAGSGAMTHGFKAALRRGVVAFVGLVLFHTSQAALVGRDIHGQAVAATAPQAVFIYDDVANLTWLRDFAAGGTLTSADAHAWVDQLASVQRPVDRRVGDIRLHLGLCSGLWRQSAGPGEQFAGLRRGQDG